MSLVSAAAHHQEELTRGEECQNCGATSTKLACCSRCRGAWFCSTKCQRAYWPFHKQWCKKNDFADAVERREPKFARWMRKHGKQAVLKDDEVDRLDRKVVTQEDMYGRANPKPTPPNFDADDMRKMRAAEEARLLALREDDATVAWREIKVPDALGLELDRYKWRQNQSFVEIFVKLPRGTTKSDVDVSLSATRLSIRVRGDVIVNGDLFAAIKAELSTWVIIDGVLEMSLLKKNRRGHYDNGCDNSHTYWRSLVSGDARALAPEAPKEYYDSEYEIDAPMSHNARQSSIADASPAPRRARGSRRGAMRGRASVITALVVCAMCPFVARVVDAALDESAASALPAETLDDGAPVRRIKFGERVQVDDVIGPVVINADCTTSYIENWKEMTTRERETTRRRLGERNRERHAECARKHENGEL